MAVFTSGGLLNEKPLARLTIPVVPMRCMDLARTPNTCGAVQNTLPIPGLEIPQAHWLGGDNRVR